MTVILKNLKDTLPALKTAWAKVTEADERDSGSRLILFMEGKRIFDWGSFEVPYGCYKSAENIMAEIEKERARLPKDGFRGLLFDLIRVCNRFKTALDKMGLSENKQWEGQLSERERDAFREALIRFKYEIGVQVAVIGETWNIEVPMKLVPEDLMLSLFPALRLRDSGSE